MRVTPRRTAVYDFDAGEFPDRPGCYLMKDSRGSVIYVGKANSLRHRLASYFRETAAPHRKAELVARVREIEVVLVRNEREALVLESHLIRHHDPAYNSRFTRDDDSYYYIALTDEPFPRVVPFRKRRTNFAIDAEGTGIGTLFGPYVGWRMRNRILDGVRAAFPLRTCHVIPARPCPRLSTDQCPAPCTEAISADDYARRVASVRRLLARPPEAYRRELRERMERAAFSEDFERAAELRDRFRAFEHAALPQAVERHRPIDLDVLYLDDGRLIRMEVRKGAVVGLDGPHAVEQTPKGVDAFLRTDGAEPSVRLLVCGAIDWRAVPTRRSMTVSRPGRSYAGQLLEICRINHAHRVRASL